MYMKVPENSLNFSSSGDEGAGQEQLWVLAGEGGSRHSGALLTGYVGSGAASCLPVALSVST